MYLRYIHSIHMYLIYIYTHIYIYNMYIVGISHGDINPIYLNEGFLKSGIPQVTMVFNTKMV